MKYINSLHLCTYYMYGVGHIAAYAYTYIIYLTIFIDGTRKVSMGSSISTEGGTNHEIVYGIRPPKKVDIDDICPPQRNCDSCPSIKCGYSGYSGCFDITPLVSNINYTGLPPRQVGKKNIK